MGQSPILSKKFCVKNFRFTSKHNSVLKGGGKTEFRLGVHFLLSKQPSFWPPPTSTKAKGAGYQAGTVSFSSFLCFWGKLVIFIPDCAG